MTLMHKFLGAAAAAAISAGSAIADPALIFDLAANLTNLLTKRATTVPNAGLMKQVANT